MRRTLTELKEECAKVGKDFHSLDITVMMLSLPDERSQTQDLLGALEALGVGRIVEVSASEPLFGVGDYRKKLERLVHITTK
jgi:hypothetical protein